MAQIEPSRAPTRVDLGDEPNFSLGDLRVFPSELAVEIGGKRREMQPRVMRVLVALARVRPSVLSRDRLIEECWDGRVVGDDAVNRCILALRHLADEFEPAPFIIETVPRVGHRLIESGGKIPALHPKRRASRALLAATTAAIVAALGLALLLGRPGRLFWKPSTRAPRVLIMPSDGGAASAALARDLAIKLGSLPQAQSAAVHLASATQGSSEGADLVLQVGQPANSGGAAANVVFMAPARHSILWSKEYEGSASNNSDLKQQIAFSTGRVLGCAYDAIAGSSRLDDQDLKTYVDACAELTDSGADSEKIVSLLRGVLARRPEFTSGWAKLLEAETREVYEQDGPEAAAARTALPRDINAARKQQPNLAAAYIAEYVLRPANDFFERSRILDAAVAQNPDEAEARVHRSLFLQSVGQIQSALSDAREAVKLDPLSPVARDAYITSLAVANRTDAARAELAEAERLWPGASSVMMARYRLNLRFGDPIEALRLLRSGSVDTAGADIQEAFLEARIARSQENIEKAVRLGRNALRYYPAAIDGHLQTLAEFGRKEELFDTLLNWRRMDLVNLITGVLFRPAFSDVRRDPRFLKVADHLGLLNFWRAKGQWPDFCSAPDLPYDCKAMTRAA